MLRESCAAFSCAARYDTSRLLRNDRITAMAISMPDTTISILAPASETCTRNERFNTLRNLISSIHYASCLPSNFALQAHAKVTKRCYIKCEFHYRYASSPLAPDPDALPSLSQSLPLTPQYLHSDHTTANSASLSPTANPSQPSLSHPYLRFLGIYLTFASDFHIN